MSNSDSKPKTSEVVETSEAVETPTSKKKIDGFEIVRNIFLKVVSDIQSDSRGVDFLGIDAKIDANIKDFLGRRLKLHNYVTLELVDLGIVLDSIQILADQAVRKEGGQTIHSFKVSANVTKDGKTKAIIVKIQTSLNINRTMKTGLIVPYVFNRKHTKVVK